MTRNQMNLPWLGLSQSVPMNVAIFLEELWQEVKCLSNLELAGISRNILSMATSQITSE